MKSKDLSQFVALSFRIISGWNIVIIGVPFKFFFHLLFIFAFTFIIRAIIFKNPGPTFAAYTS